MPLKIAFVIGERIGAYLIVQQIGEGGMGTVWLAEHAMLGRRAAIKMLHASMSASREVTMRFFNEARAATAIQDAGIVQIFDFGQHVDGRAYIVMELLDGESLEQRLNRLGRLPAADALRIMRQVASSLGAAHARGIVHRDLKPDNIFLVRDAEVPGGERAKILDFGIAKIADASGMKTDTELVMGTPMFMSPEQCRGAGKVDQRSDVYSLGCMFFTLLTGRTPFVGEGPGDIIAMHLREMPPVPSTLAAGIPHSVDSLVLRCMEKDPARRFTSAREVAEAISTISVEPRTISQSDPQGSGIRAVAPRDYSTTLTSYSQLASQRDIGRNTKRGDRRLALTATAGVLLSGTTAFLLLRNTSSHEEPVSVASNKPASTSQPPPAPTVPAIATTSEPDPPPEPARVVEPPAPTPSPSAGSIPKNASASTAPPVSADKQPPRAPKTQPRSPVTAQPGKRSSPAAPATSIAAQSPTAAEPAPEPEPPADVSPSPPVQKAVVQCDEQIAMLDSFIAAHYKLGEQEQVRVATSFVTGCFDRKDRLRLAMIGIDAACKLDLKSAVIRFHDIVDSPSLRARCPKFFAEEENAEGN